MRIESAYDIWASQYDTNNNLTRDLDLRATLETLKRFDFSTVLELGCKNALPRLISFVFRK